MEFLLNYFPKGFCSLFALPFFFVFSGTGTANGQDADQEYFEQDRVRLENRSYRTNIRTVLINKTGFDLSEPVIELGNEESVTLRFDDLDDETKDFQYGIVHCTWDWQPSGMIESDYLGGMWNDRINDREFSFNTIVPFVHYSLQIPNENTQIKRSGNYILRVFEGDDPEKVVLTQRFMVVEPGVEVEGRIRDARNASDRRYKQEVSIKVVQNEIAVADPFGQLKVVLMQNMRWDDIRTPNPQFVRGNELLYQDDNDLIFNGGNEFRHFDIRTLRFNTEFVKDIELENNSSMVTLRPDQKRNIAVYRSQPDINGKFMIENQDGFERHLESDYVYVRFTLESPVPFNNGNIYVHGALSNGHFDEDNKMVYSDKMGVYFHQALLKQGWYDYEYAFLADTAEVADPGFIEGDHSETSNDYATFVYFHDQSSNYDRLVGVRFFNSMRDRY